MEANAAGVCVTGETSSMAKGPMEFCFLSIQKIVPPRTQMRYMAIGLEIGARGDMFFRILSYSSYEEWKIGTK